jgi:PKD repeat protein
MHKRPVLDVGRDVDLPGPARTGIFNGDNAAEINVGAPGSPVAGPQYLANTSTGGVFYQATDFPESYRGTYFHADFGQRWIKSIVFDANHRPTQVNHFASDVRTVFLASHPTDGGLYYVDMTIPVVRKIVYAPGGNRAPVAAASVDRAIGDSPLTVQFSSTGSRDPDGQALTYRWEFGDGAESTAANPTHTFTAATAKRFDVRLTVTDPAGATSQATVAIFAAHALPQVELLSPVQGTKYPLTGPTDYRLTRRVTEVPGHPTTTRWNVYLVHHEHEHAEPAITAPETVATLSPVWSETESYSYRVTLTVTDDLGATVQREVRLFPNASNLVPQLSWSRASQTASLETQALLDASATLSDPDSAGIESGELRINCSSEVEFSILSTGTGLGQVSTSDGSVFFAGVNVGSVVISSSSLSVSFNDAATPAAAQAILRRIAVRFSTEGPKIFTGEVRDGDGATSTVASLTVNASDPANAAIQVLAVTGAPVPGEPEGSVYGKFGLPSAGPFGGRVRSGAQQWWAIFAADGSVRIKSGDPAPGLDGAKLLKLGAPSGDAALATLAIGAGGVSTPNDAVLLAGLVDGPLRIAAREGDELANLPGVAIKKFLSIDGAGAPDAPSFFTAFLRGVGVTAANNHGLCVALPDGTVRLLTRKGDSVGGKKISIISSLIGTNGTLAANRWRAGDAAIGVRLTFTDKTQAIYTIPSGATGPEQWVRRVGTGDALSIEEEETLIRSFSFPGFGSASVAVIASLQPGGDGVTALNNRAVISAGADELRLLAREGTAAPEAELPFASFGDPIVGPDEKVAFSAKVTSPSAVLVSSLWYSPDGATVRELARSGEDAPGGGSFAAFTSMVWPGDQASGPAFTGMLRAGSSAGISLKNNTGLWAVDATGTLQLLLRTGQRIVVDGAERVVTSFVALTPAVGSVGTAHGYDSSGNIVVNATLDSGATARLLLRSR